MRWWKLKLGRSAGCTTLWMHYMPLHCTNCTKLCNNNESVYFLAPWMRLVLGLTIMMQQKWCSGILEPGLKECGNFCFLEASLLCCKKPKPHGDELRPPSTDYQAYVSEEATSETSSYPSTPSHTKNCTVIESWKIIACCFIINCYFKWKGPGN